MSSYYDLLGISQLASDQDIKRAYRNMAKQLHPDVNTSQDAHQRFVLIHKAYQTLIDKNKRYLYDNIINNRKSTLFEQKNYPYNQYAKFYNTSSYNDWIKIQKEKAQMEAKLRHEEFLRNKARFRSSALYYPTYVFIYIATCFCYLLGIGILCICGLVVLRTHFIFTFFLSPFICGGIYFIKCTGDWFQEGKRYL
jgi:hypothetical protein